MKTSILLCMCVAFLLSAKAADSDYQADLRKTRERLEALEIQRDDYRKITPDNRRPVLSPAEEAERYRLLGQLLNDDPIWALTRQLEGDIDALTTFRKDIPPGNPTVLEELKELLVLSSSFEGRATTRAEAEKVATTLRQFIALRDVAGAEAWAQRYAAQ